MRSSLDTDIDPNIVGSDMLSAFDHRVQPNAPRTLDTTMYLKADQKMQMSQSIDLSTSNPQVFSNDGLILFELNFVKSDLQRI